jgi:hypothetical protein
MFNQGCDQGGIEELKREIMLSPNQQKIVRTLESDRIITTMAQEIPEYILDNNIDIMHVFYEYKRRGGSINTHIGGPKEAILNIRRRNRAQAEISAGGASRP